MANSLQEENDEMLNQSASVLVVDSTVNDAKYVSNTCLVSSLLNYAFETLMLHRHPLF